MTRSQIFPADKSAVLLVAESLRGGGQASYARMLRRGLAAAGMAPRLAAPEGPPTGVPRAGEPEVAIFPGMAAGAWRPFAFRRLVQWARQEQFALIHGLSAFTASSCERLAAALDIPFVVSVHHYQDRGDLRLERHCQGILACSESIRENLVNDARLPKERVHLVPLGIEIPEVDPARAPPEERLPLIACFAPFTPPQDVATFVRAARLIADARPGTLQFVAVGEGPEESALRKLARRLKLEKQLTFSHENIPHEQLLPDVDVYVQTARREGFGFSVLEAMAWGRPVVATTAGGLISLVRDGQTGFLVPVGQPEAVAAKVLDLLGSRELRVKMGTLGREQAIREFSLPRMIERTLRLYASVLGLKEQPANASG
jgi:glycosyltransferase involved in cell wall biosynthesis